MKKTTTALLIGSILASGCSTLDLKSSDGPALRMNDGERVMKDKDLNQLMDDTGWGEPALRVSPTPPITLIAPSVPPKNIQAKNIELSMEPGSTVRDLAAALGAVGYSVVIADETAANKPVFIPNYKGQLGGLLKVVSKAADVYFLWQGNSLYVSGKERIAMSVPQDFYTGIKSFYALLENEKKSEARVVEDTSQEQTDKDGKVVPETRSLAERIAYQMFKMGILDAEASQEAGFISFTASHNQLEALKTYLDRSVANSAVVTLQVLVVNVQLEKDNKRGVDWEKLNTTFGQSPNVLMSNLLNGGLTGNVAQMPTEGATGFYQKYGIINGQAGGFGVNAGTRQFNVNAFINALDKFGRAEALQNAVMKTVTGSEVILDSASLTPYVERVEVSTAGQSGSQAQSVVTSSARDGLFLKLKPLYDAGTGIVTIDAGISLDSVLRLVDLNAGGLGRLTQPVTTQRRFNSVMRLRPGQTAIVGGLIFETGNASQAALAGAPNTASENDNRVRNEMFIAIRPSIEVLGRVAVKQENADEPSQITDTMNAARQFKTAQVDNVAALNNAMDDLVAAANSKSKSEIRKEFEKVAKELEAADNQMAAGKAKIGEVRLDQGGVKLAMQAPTSYVAQTQAVKQSVEKVRLAAYRMRIRQEAGLESKTVNFLKEGAEVEIVDRKVIDGTERILISLEGRELGWATAKYFEQV